MAAEVKALGINMECWEEAACIVVEVPRRTGQGSSVEGCEAPSWCTTLWLATAQVCAKWRRPKWRKWVSGGVVLLLLWRWTGGVAAEAMRRRSQSRTRKEWQLK
ncbi:hypothetical protein C5167_027978 [Papaver somniferum]|nr:hypothetical protein C5167_027978 [Papaver somniferum]